MYNIDNKCYADSATDNTYRKTTSTDEVDGG